MNDHALAVDSGDLEMAHLRAAQARCIQHHQHGAMHQVPGRINKPSFLLLIQYGRQSPLTLGERNVIGKIGPAQRLDEQKSQRRSTAFDGSCRKLALAKQIRLVLPDMLRAKTLWRTMEVLREVLTA